jgi:hypothetical protein
VNATVVAGKVVYERSDTKLAAAAASRTRAHDHHGVRCYQGGACCCVLTDQIRAGRV